MTEKERLEWYRQVLLKEFCKQFGIILEITILMCDNR